MRRIPRLRVGLVFLNQAARAAIHPASRPRITAPSLARSAGRWRRELPFRGGMPSRCRNVAVRSAGETGDSAGRPPSRSDCAVDFARADARAGEQDRLHLRPVLAAALAVDLRRAAEFAHDDDERFFQQAAAGEVVEQGADGGVGRRGEAVLQVREVVLVRVPDGRIVRAFVVPIDRDELHARFEQPPARAGSPGRRDAGRRPRGAAAIL